MDDINTDSTENDIAIVGMACRFPGAKTPSEFWANLREGRESLSALTDDELLAAGVTREQINNPSYVKSGMFLDDFDAFDAEFFGFSPLDARILDPQHRHFLECSWEAFEDAGYVPGNIDGAVGVFAGSGHNSYLSQNLLNNHDLVNDVGFFLLRHTGNDKDFLATRVSYLLNLKGPSVNVQTACSTSLVAIHMATQSLLNGESDMALAGGVTIEMPQRHGYQYKESEILSPDGHCRPFDADSKGTVFGSGVGCVLLKRYNDAVADNDNIHAVIKGTAVNNDGSDKISYLAPSVDGQVAAIREALDVGEIDPSTVSYIECHGTGTQMGDPIEVTALTQAYNQETDQQHQCGIGSVKSNIGHTDTAAGVASLIKVVQSLKHRELAPTLHYQKANPSIDFDNSPFYVNTALRDWESQSPLRAGVSSLGVGGTNAHIIIEESVAANNTHANAADQSCHEELICISAKSDLSLQKYTAALAENLYQRSDLPLHDICHTLASGRSSFKHRAFAIASSTKELTDLLDSQQNNTLAFAEAPGDKKSICLMFAGGGTQHSNMGRELYDSEPVFKTAVDECLELLKNHVDFDLKSILYPDRNESDNIMARPSRGLPALFITQYAQTQLWKSWGIDIDAMIGHSMGENTAACVAGVFSLKDAIGLVALRGQLFETVDPGGMLSVSISASQLTKLTEPLGLDIAASNAPELSVASGNKERLVELQSILTAKEITFQQIHIDVAAHSRMLANILVPFREYLNSIELKAPSIAFISNLTSNWITEEEATDPEYWVSHLRNTVAFDAGILNLLNEDKYVFLEAGPGRTLSSLTRLQNIDSSRVIEPSMPHINDEATDRQTMLFALGRLWQGGAEVDPGAQYQDSQRVSLPTYQFARNKHWVDIQAQNDSHNTRADLPEKSFYQPVWQRASGKLPDIDTILADKTILMIAGTHPVNDSITDALIERNSKIITVSEGNEYSKVSPQHYAIDLTNSEHYLQLVKDLISVEQLPDYVVHSLALNCKLPFSTGSIKQDTTYCFDSLFLLANACINEDMTQAMQWLIITQAAQQLAGEITNSPMQSMVHGPSKVIAAECPTISCKTLDLPDSIDESHLIINLLATLADSNSKPTQAYRGNVRYIQTFQKIASPEDAPQPPALRKGGTYLITGGTGGLGLIAAETLAAIENVHLVLLSRSPLPPREQWQQHISGDDAWSGILSRIEKIQESGSTVTHYSADIGDLEEITALRQIIDSELGGLAGIIHTAGVVDDNLIALKNIDQCAQVLKPKVQGTVVLNEVFDIEQLEFLLLYSSISSFTGLQGQIDYAAANCFLDSFASFCSANGSDNVTSINWPAWKEDGMAARMLSSTNIAKPLIGTPAMHPLLDTCSIDNESLVEFRSILSTNQVWMLDEHRLANGTALIPGSGFMELARAAFSESTGHSSVKILNATFLSPFMVDDLETKELIVTLKRIDTEVVDSSFAFEITSTNGSVTDTHATGEIHSDTGLAGHVVPAELVQRCSNGSQYFDHPDHHPNLKFGHRWSSLKKVNIADGDAVIELALDEKYHRELANYSLHPAMLDMATGGAQVLIPDYKPKEEFYVPVEYGTLSLNGSFPAIAFSHVELKHADATLGSAVFNVSVYDENGNLFLTVDEFIMQRVNAGAISAVSNTAADEGNSLLTKTMELGIYSEEGANVLESIIAGQYLPQKIVSPYDLDHVTQQLSASQPGLSAAPKKESTTRAHDPDADADLASIESTLSQNEAIEFIAVRSHLNEDGSRRLVAHFKVDDWEGITVSELRKYAREVLDRTNVPQHFVELDDIPLTDSGDTDRHALTDPYAPVDRHVAPRTPVEQKLADIWSEVLGAEKVSISDNFFDIGGHSLLSIRVIVKAQKLFSAQLDQAQMVLLTLEQQASEIQRQLPESNINAIDSHQDIEIPNMANTSVVPEGITESQQA